jgi:hypothetical protein
MLDGLRRHNHKQQQQQQQQRRRQQRRCIGWQNRPVQYQADGVSVKE